MGDFVRGDFVWGDFVQGDFVQGDFVLEPPHTLAYIHITRKDPHIHPMMGKTQKSRLKTGTTQLVCFLKTECHFY